ncbi:Ribokinase-like protein [Lipomyces oligophaga]|uniref:Ribokinase-like protein n=1 Tax=Lipomyces oligophaga TaxID=45792 RepID=UPI0034CEE2D9
MHITVLGSLNYDMVMFTPRIPLGGETIHADMFATHRGGKGSNQALAIRRLSRPEVQVRMVGRVGTDAFGKELKSGLEAEGIDVSMIVEVDGSSGVAVILVERDGQNRILVSAGANNTVKPTDIDISLLQVGENLTDFLVLQNELPLDVVAKAIQLASRNKVNVVYNPSPMSFTISSWAKSVLSQVNYLIVNESEAQQLCGTEYQDLFKEVHLDGLCESLQPAIASIHTSFALYGTVVITFGSLGVIYSTFGNPLVHCPAFKASKVVDTTGAGDSFLGGFLGAIADGKLVSEAVKYGSAAGSIAVTREGAADGIPFLPEIIDLL